MATVPGTFTSPASRAYLYYTNERKHWVAPSTVTIAPLVGFGAVGCGAIGFGARPPA